MVFLVAVVDKHLLGFPKIIYLGFPLLNRFISLVSFVLPKLYGIILINLRLCLLKLYLKLFVLLFLLFKELIQIL